MKTFKLRAECLNDVTKFIAFMMASKIESGAFVITPMKIGEARIPDCTLEFNSAMTLSEIHGVLLRIQDSHVMIETVATAAKYTGERK